MIILILVLLVWFFSLELRFRKLCKHLDYDKDSIKASFINRIEEIKKLRKRMNHYHPYKEDEIGEEMEDNFKDILASYSDEWIYKGLNKKQEEQQ